MIKKIPIFEISRISLALLGVAAHSISAAQGLPSAPVSPAPIVSFEYDANGNVTKKTQAPGVSGFGFVTSQTYDGLQRKNKITDAKSGTTKILYNGQGNLTQITDPRSLSTNYAPSGLGNISQLSSPDTGVYNSTFDAAGNLLTKTDSRGVLETWAYDALNRPTQVVYSQTGKTSETRQWFYDSLGTGFTNGIGRVVKWSYDAGTTTYEYDALGRLSIQSQTVNAATGANTAALIQRVNYGYDGANHLTSITYPTGRRVDYVYVNGQLSSVKLAETAASLTPQTLLSAITWEPFGQISGWKWNLTGGTTQDHRRAFDNSGRWVRYRLGSVIRDVSYDAANRITQYTHYDATTGTAQTALNQSFAYDELGRLTQATSGTTTWTLSYDANGNRTSLSTNGVARAYTVATTSNRLQSLSNPAATQTQDAAGNTLSDSSKSYTATYNLAGRMSSLLKGGVTTTYTYDTGGQRIRKFSSSGASSTVIFAYDMAGHLLGEYSNTGAALREYIWVGDTPVAMFTATAGSATPTVYYLHTDHLNTPRVAMSQSNQLRWRWLAEPFGTTAEENNPAGLGVFTQNLRFPGQYADSESGLYYNYFRDYDAATGRYVESDPIGLAGGINTYSYVGGNPLMLTDPYGLDPWYNGPWPNPSDKYMSESREETMRRICAYAATPWNGAVPRTGIWFDLNQRNAEHYFFGNELGHKLGPGAPVAVAIWEISKWPRALFGKSTPPTALGAEIGQAGAYDGWVRGKNSPEECKCLTH